jgi:hypothetical protein
MVGPSDCNELGKMRKETVLALIHLEEQRKRRTFWQGSLCLGRDLNPEPWHNSCPPDRKVEVIEATLSLFLAKRR